MVGLEVLGCLKEVKKSLRYVKGYVGYLETRQI